MSEDAAAGQSRMSEDATARQRRVTDTGARDIVAPAALGFEQLLDRSPMPARIIAADRSITLSLTADEFLALLAENVELAEGIFRMLIATHDLATGHTLIPGDLPAELKAPADLRPLDRALLLQASPLLAHATATQLWRLSAIAHESRVAAGTEAIAKGTEAAILVVLAGSLRVEGATQSGTADSGDVIGMYETLAGSPLDATVTAITDSVVMRIDRGGLFDVLADHTDLLQGIFSVLLSVSARSALRRGKLGSTIPNTVLSLRS